ncbi:effector protein Tle3 domain-containing protein [Zoogloea sp.]|uniref:effector protein Tle3 domain-containing protein n=1 Tax=Zoogloea sp. TaxID=49181 RepID=UPI003FCE929F
MSRDRGVKQVQQIIPDPRPGMGQAAGTSSGQTLNPGEIADIEARLNDRKVEGDHIKINRGMVLTRHRLHITRPETPNEARLRHQKSTSSRSFHSAIWASKANHAKVTAYDIAIGRGQAVTDKEFYAYLCAVADWRLKKPTPNEKIRPGILTWETFNKRYGKYFECERDEIKQIVEGNCDYYSTGVLPACVPTVDRRPPAVVAETTDGRSVPITPRKQGKTP